MAELLIGSFQSVHAPDYLSSAVDHAIACGENCFMFYNGAPQTTIRVDWQQMHREQFFAKMKEYQLDLANIIVHAPYVINPATNDPVLAKKTLTVLNKEIAYCEHFQVHKLVIHPGNAVNGISVETAIANCAKLINNLTNKNVIICLETMAGKGTEIGANFKQIKQIIDQVKNQALIGVCLDTCHI
jgi:deoxyribonuclease-4